MTWKNWKKAFTLVVAFSVGVTIVNINKKPVERVNERYVDVVKKTIDSTVTIHVTLLVKDPNTGRTQMARIGGSGVFISNNGHILTCDHLFNMPYKIMSITVITNDQWESKATILFEDEHRDLALIKIASEGTPKVRLADPKSLKVGQEVVAIGTPLGLANTVTTGIISALHRNDLRYDMVQMSASINPGNSGGPLFNLDGELVGINVMIVATNSFLPTWTGLGFSVSASEISKFLDNFRGLPNG